MPEVGHVSYSDNACSDTEDNNRLGSWRQDESNVRGERGGRMRAGGDDHHDDRGNDALFEQRDRCRVRILRGSQFPLQLCVELFLVLSTLLVVSPSYRAMSTCLPSNTTDVAFPAVPATRTSIRRRAPIIFDPGANRSVSR